MKNSTAKCVSYQATSRNTRSEFATHSEGCSYLGFEKIKLPIFSVQRNEGCQCMAVHTLQRSSNCLRARTRVSRHLANEARNGGVWLKNTKYFCSGEANTLNTSWMKRKLFEKMFVPLDSTTLADTSLRMPMSHFMKGFSTCLNFWDYIAARVMSVIAGAGSTYSITGVASLSGSSPSDMLENVAGVDTYSSV